MKKNMGSADRILRTLAAIVLVILIATAQVEGTLAIVLGVVAAVMLLTSLVSFCPLYGPLKISTRKENKGA